MKNYELPLDKTGLMQQIVLSGILVIVTCVLVTLFFGRVSGIMPTIYRLLIFGVWVALVGTWIVLSYRELSNWSKTSYTLLADSLRIRKKGWIGRSSEQLYRYDSILSVDSTSFKHGQYGLVEISFTHQENIILHNLANPEKQATKIKERVALARSIIL